MKDPRFKRNLALVLLALLVLVGFAKIWLRPSVVDESHSKDSTASTSSPTPSSAPSSALASASPSPLVNREQSAPRPLFAGLAAAAAGHASNTQTDSALPPLPTEFPKAPSMATYRDEARKNPHGTPPALREFARQAGSWMEHALHPEATPEARHQVAQNLIACATQDENATPPSVLSFCWGSLRQLVRAFPQDTALGDLAHAAEKNVASSTRARAEGLEAL